MPSKSVTLNDEQYRYVINTQGEEQSFSERMRELVDKGIGVEE